MTIRPWIEAPGRARAGSSSRWAVFLIFLGGVAIRAWLIARYPFIFGDDTISRLARADHVMVGHWLPLLQLAIHGLSLESRSPLLVQGFMAVVGAVAGLGFYLLATDLLT